MRERTTVDLPWIKVAVAAAVFVVGLLGSLLPWGLRRTPTDRWLALGDTFAGGVLGGAGLIHLLDSGIAGFRTAVPEIAYPLALLIAGGGFLFILLIEGVVVADWPGVPDPHGGHRSPAVTHEIGSRPRTPTAAFILLIVLSIHSVILGVALGAQRTLSATMVVFLAIIAHKGVAGFALGVGYRGSGFSRGQALPSVALFATMTPLGILVGTGVSSALSSHPGEIFEATFNSIGAGTFIYIAALDIIRTEFDAPGDRWQKWVSASLGFAVMAVLALWL
jgi:zinc transporter 1/2/3